MCGCELLCGLFKRLMQFGRQEYPAHLCSAFQHGAAGSEGFLTLGGCFSVHSKGGIGSGIQRVGSCAQRIGLP